MSTKINLYLIPLLLISLTACEGGVSDTGSIHIPGQTTEAVVAVNLLPESAPAVDSVDNIQPNIPMALRALGITSSEISISWNASTDNVGVVGYRIYKNGSSTHFASTATLSLVDSGLNAGQSYQYRVTAIDEEANESGLSSSLIINTLPEPDISAPTIPSNVRSTDVTSSEISISWNAASDNVGVVGYRIYKNGSLTHFASTATLSLVDSGLNAGQSYQYRVTAIDEEANESNMSSVLSINTLTVINSQPANLSWKSPTRNSDESCLANLQGYQVSYGISSENYTENVQLPLSEGQVSCVQSGFDAVCNEPIMSCSYSTAPLSAGTWYFAVKAYDQLDVYSPYSIEASKIIM